MREDATTVTSQVDATPGRAFLALGTGELLSRLIGFTGTIYLARELGVEMYGVIGLGFAVLLYTTIIADCGLEYTGPREVVDAGAALPRLVSSMLATRLLAAALVAAVQVAVALLFEGPERIVLIVYALALLPVGLNLRWVHLGLERVGIVSTARVAGETLKLILVLGFVREPADVLVVPFAQVAGDVLAALILLLTLRRRGVTLTWSFDAAFALGAVRRAMPMLGSAALAMVIYNSDLFFLRLFRDSVDVGRYVAAYALLNFLGILGHLVALSLTPALTRLRGAPDQRSALLQRALVGIFALGLPVAAGGALTAPLIIGLTFGGDYQASSSVLAVLIWCLPILWYRSAMQAALVSAERVGEVLKTTVAAATTNVGLNLVAVPLLGTLGAAITTVAAEAVRALLARWYARRAGFAMPAIRRYGRALGAALAMVAVLILVHPANLWLSIALAGATYLTALVVVGGLRVRRDGIQLSA